MSLHEENLMHASFFYRLWNFTKVRRVQLVVTFLAFTNIDTNPITIFCNYSDKSRDKSRDNKSRQILRDRLQVNGLFVVKTNAFSSLKETL